MPGPLPLRFVLQSESKDREAAESLLMTNQEARFFLAHACHHILTNPLPLTTPLAAAHAILNCLIRILEAEDSIHSILSINSRDAVIES
jgi:hypothetical protein